MPPFTLEERLHRAGYKLTTPRRVVAEVLESQPQHLTANEIWECVKALDETIGRMSVYRTLDIFTRVGYVRPTSQSDSDARSGVVYVVLREGHHHHIICQRCNRVIDFADCELDDLITHLENRYGCSIDGHLLEFYGVCAECLKTSIVVE
jgi:Fur family ferric uptake transcriptional regulator